MADPKKPTANQTGGDPSAQKADLADPAQAVTQAGDPERFLAQKPAHIAALGENAPPTPNADVIDERRMREAEKAGKRWYKLGPTSGWFDGNTHHPPGALVAVSEEQLDVLKSHGLITVDESGEPTPMRVTTEARGQRTR